MFLVKPVDNRIFFFWKPQRVLLCCITIKPENFSFPCTGHSPSSHLLSSAPEQKEKFGFCPERTLPPKNTVSSGWQSVMTLTVPLAVPVPWKGPVGFYTCWVCTILQSREVGDEVPEKFAPL